MGSVLFIYTVDTSGSHENLSCIVGSSASASTCFYQSYTSYSPSKTRSLLAYATKLFAHECIWEPSAGVRYISPPLSTSGIALSGTSFECDLSPYLFYLAGANVSSQCRPWGTCQRCPFVSDHSSI